MCILFPLRQSRCAFWNAKIHGQRDATNISIKFRFIKFTVDTFICYSRVSLSLKCSIAVEGETYRYFMDKKILISLYFYSFFIVYLLVFYQYKCQLQDVRLRVQFHVTIKQHHRANCHAAVFPLFMVLHLDHSCPANTHETTAYQRQRTVISIGRYNVM